MSSKFHYKPMGTEPVFSSSNMRQLPANKIVQEAATHVRRHSAAGVTPPVEAPTTVLLQHPNLANAAIQLGAAYFNAHAGGVKPPTATAISNAVPELAQSIGMNPSPSTQPAKSPIIGASKRSPK